MAQLRSRCFRAVPPAPRPSWPRQTRRGELNYGSKPACVRCTTTSSFLPRTASFTAPRRPSLPRYAHQTPPISYQNSTRPFSMEKIESLASQVKQVAQGAAEHVATQIGLRREALFDVGGRVALVTGGGSGIGLMIARALALNGAKVYITGRTAEKLERVVESFGKDIPGKLIPVTCDITKKESITELYNYIAEREQCLCILVNNAGISTGRLPMGGEESADDVKERLFTSDQSTFDSWIQDYQTNTAAVYFTTAAFLPLLQRSTEHAKGWSGTVVNIASISGQVKTAQKHFSYNAAKAATIHLTRMLAAEVAAAGLKIRVNSISPGVFPSEMTTKGVSGADQRSELPREKGREFPSGRVGREEEMASTVLFCVTNQYLNGQDITVDGGATLSMGR